MELKKELNKLNELKSAEAAKFTQEEITTLNFALQDISRGIGATVIKG
ncbi:MAG: hypothetical protein LBR52_02900 [Prevotellaceae bacterium]|jgi:hypothetical protein|nr:hypothetical protein [Prevotellaceae bacterium]